MTIVASISSIPVIVVTHSPGAQGGGNRADTMGGCGCSSPGPESTYGQCLSKSLARIQRL